MSAVIIRDGWQDRLADLLTALRLNPTGEVILASIYAQLGKLPQPVDDTPTDDSDLSFESSEVAADPERAEEQEAEEQPPDELTGGLSVSTRTRMAFERFFKRFITAIANDEFVKELGPTVDSLGLDLGGSLHHLGLRGAGRCRRLVLSPTASREEGQKDYRREACFFMRRRLARRFPAQVAALASMRD